MSFLQPPDRYLESPDITSLYLMLPDVPISYSTDIYTVFRFLCADTRSSLFVKVRAHIYNASNYDILNPNASKTPR